MTYSIWHDVLYVLYMPTFLIKKAFSWFIFIQLITSLKAERVSGHVALLLKDTRGDLAELAVDGRAGGAGLGELALDVLAGLLAEGWKGIVLVKKMGE